MEPLYRDIDWQRIAERALADKAALEQAARARSPKPNAVQTGVVALMVVISILMLMFMIHSGSSRVEALQQEINRLQIENANKETPQYFYTSGNDKIKVTYSVVPATDPGTIGSVFYAADFYKPSDLMCITHSWSEP